MVKGISYLQVERAAMKDIVEKEINRRLAHGINIVVTDFSYNDGLKIFEVEFKEKK